MIIGRKNSMEPLFSFHKITPKIIRKIFYSMKTYLLFALALTCLSMPLVGFCRPQESLKIAHDASDSAQKPSTSAKKQLSDSVLPIQETVLAGLAN